MSLCPCLSSSSKPCLALAMDLLSWLLGTTKRMLETDWRDSSETNSQRSDADSVQSSKPPTASTPPAIVATPANSPLYCTVRYRKTGEASSGCSGEEDDAAAAVAAAYAALISLMTGTRSFWPGGATRLAPKRLRCSRCSSSSLLRTFQMK